jgi:glycosyltransferase involved in cell wall biosynthesis
MARFDVLFAPNFVPPPTRSDRVVLTVHDLGFRRFPETAPQTTRRWLARLDRALAGAARILAVSEATKADLVELAGVEPSRIVVTPLGVDPEVYRPAPPSEVNRARAAFDVPGRYVLSIGGIEPRKNLPRLVEAFGRLPGDLDVALVIAGGGVAWNPEGREALEAAIRRLPPDRAGRVRRTGYVAERDKVALLTGAEVMAYPSLYEGFGLPVLEAMACGAPVLTSSRSSLPEVAGDAARLVDPEDADAIAGALGALLVDEAGRERLRAAGVARAAGFRWEETARRTAEVLREVGARRPG